mmetsp:Transcript_26369/g.40252  ORF Transcript_26369/g.40252 Transcript_26369/m.40252 type:complete len:94 (-) Transcript_26369:6060-6341(-)
MLFERDEEISTFKKDVKTTKNAELALEVEMYGKECTKLRRISEQAVGLLMLNGLEHQLKNNRDLKSFSKIFKWTRVPSESSPPPDKGRAPSPT